MTAQLNSHLVLHVDETRSLIVFIFSGRRPKQAMAVRGVGSANRRYVATLYFVMLQIHIRFLSLLNVMLWSGLDTKTTLLGLGKDHI